MCDKCNEGTPVIRYSKRDEIIHWEICETDGDCEIWIKRSPWCNTQASIKLAWPVRRGLTQGLSPMVVKFRLKFFLNSLPLRLSMNF